MDGGEDVLVVLLLVLVAGRDSPGERRGDIEAGQVSLHTGAVAQVQVVNVSVEVWGAVAVFS